MKKFLLLIFVALAVRADAYTITNFSSVTDTNWGTNVIPKLNANNGNFVAWLNSHDATNAIFTDYWTNFFSQPGITNLVATNALAPSVSGATGFIPTNNLSGMVTNNAVGVTLTGTFNGNGVGLTNIPTSGITWITNNSAPLNAVTPVAWITNLVNGQVLFTPYYK